MELTATAVLGLIACAYAAPGAPVRLAAEGRCTGADEVQLYYRKIGHGRPSAIFLHGGPGGNIHSTWLDLEPLARGRTILVYDQRGGGRSQVVSDPALLTAAAHVRDLEAIRRCHGLEKMTLIGQSWGAALAALYAAEHPQRVSRLLLLGPMPLTKSLYQQRFATLEREAGGVGRLAALRKAIPTADDPVSLCREFWQAYLPPYFVDPALARKKRGTMCDAPPAALRNWPTVLDATMASLGEWDFAPVLRGLSMPALVVEGEQSHTTVASARAWAAALPSGRLLLIPNSGHFPQIEQPASFFDAAAAFLDAPPRP